MRFQKWAEKVRVDREGAAESSFTVKGQSHQVGTGMADSGLEGFFRWDRQTARQQSSRQGQ